MTPKVSTRDSKDMPVFSDVQLSQIAEIVRQCIGENHKPRFAGWQILVAWTLSLIIPAMGGVIQIRGVMDQVTQQQQQIATLQESKMNKDVALEHWRAVDQEIRDLQEADKRIEAEATRRK